MSQRLLPGAGPAARLVREGDLVIVYERFDSMKAVTVTSHGQYNSKWGNFAMRDWLGRPFGSRVQARSGAGGYAFLLEPTAELWTTVLRHRTQILYIADISLVCHHLELRPGSVVLESGTGSGSLTTSLARAVAPSGRVHTFDFHQQRAEAARDEFEANGLAAVVAAGHRNIEQDGFPPALHGAADAVFLDLPGPWRAVPSAAACLRGDGVFCSFSPCIEQVQRTCGELNACGFRDMRTIEVLLREYDVSWGRPLPDPGALLAAQAAAQAAGGRSNKRHKAAAPQQAQQAEDAAAAPAPDSAAADEQPAQAPAAAAAEKPAAGAAAMPAPPAQRVVARPISQGRGHTGYLTFARKAVMMAAAAPDAPAAAAATEVAAEDAAAS